MTTFEQAVICLLILIVVLIGFIAFCVWNHYRDAELNNFMTRKKLDNIDTNTATSVSVGIDMKDKIGNIGNNILDELRNMNSKSICWNELTDDQKSEILYRLTHPVVESPFKPPFNPTCETTNKED
jgi:hypothetical protein